MKLAGVTCVRNEVDIIEFCLWHHFDQGLDDIFILDNGSSDGTYDLLKDLEKKDSRLHIFSDPDKFNQMKFVKQMTDLAIESGADWIVPFDADEMWLSKNGLANDLVDIDIDGVVVYLTNFVQNVRRRTIEPDLYKTVKYKLDVKIPYRPAAAMDFQLVEWQSISMVELKWYPKNIIRAMPGLIIRSGAHSFEVPNKTSETAFSHMFSIYHVPLRSYPHLEFKAEHGKRLIENGVGPGIGVEQQRLYRIQQGGALLREWSMNSEKDGKLRRGVGDSVPLVYDSSVADLFERFEKETK